MDDIFESHTYDRASGCLLLLATITVGCVVLLAITASVLALRNWW